MKNIKQLIKAIKENKTLIWNNPDPIFNKNYIIETIQEIDETFDENSPILIQYDNGQAEAKIFLKEIEFSLSTKEDLLKSVVYQIEEDIEFSDLTSLYELLESTDIINLINYLPENKHKQFKNLLNEKN